MLLVLVGGLVVVLYKLIGEYGSDVEKISGVAGAVVPAIGVIAGAAFGVAVGWPGGKEAGKATGRKAAKKEVARELKPLAEDAEAKLNAIVGQLETNLESPKGTRGFQLAPGESLDQGLSFDSDMLVGAKTAVAALAKRCDDLAS
jgi:hypothetical protein